MARPGYTRIQDRPVRPWRRTDARKERDSMRRIRPIAVALLGGVMFALAAWPGVVLAGSPGDAGLLRRGLDILMLLIEMDENRHALVQGGCTDLAQWALRGDRGYFGEKTFHTKTPLCIYLQQ